MSPSSDFQIHAVFHGPVKEFGERGPFVLETDWGTEGNIIGGGVRVTGKVPDNVTPGLYRLLRLEQKRVSDGAVQTTGADNMQNAPQIEVIEPPKSGAFPSIRF